MKADLIAAVAAVSLVAGAPAGAATPAAMLAKTLKVQLQAYYKKDNPDLKITTVTCKIAPSKTSATCKAAFTVASARAEGVFDLRIQINTATGAIKTKTVGVTCRDSKTGAKLTC